MASHQVSLNQNVYNKLKKEKEQGESFSDVILRLLENKSNVGDIIAFYGASSLDNSEDEEFILDSYAKSSRELRERFKSRNI